MKHSEEMVDTEANQGLILGNLNQKLESISQLVERENRRQKAGRGQDSGRAELVGAWGPPHQMWGRRHCNA